MGSFLLVGLPAPLGTFLERRLRGPSRVIAEARDLVQADAQLEAGAPEAIVLDLRRCEAAAWIAAGRRRGWAMPMLVLAGPAGEHLAALEAGATDFLLEPFDPETVAVRIESRLHPPIVLGETLRLTDRVVHLERSVVEHDGREVRLSPTERDLLTYLASRPGWTITRDTLLQQVWGYRPGVRSRTTTTTIARLRAKIEPDPADPVHIQVVHGVGYRFEPLDGPVEPPVHVAASRFFGREEELDALVALLGEARLVTVVGTGGVGKTRLARETATRLGGGWFCDLSEARDAAGVYRAVAAGLGVSLGGGDPEAGLAAVLASRRGALVVLDNLEQVAEPAGEILGRWLSRSPETRFLATSRMPLRLGGEHLFPVEPLPVPPAGADASLLERNAAGALFLDRARASRPDLRLHGTEGDVAAIVRMLDGLPLALELAAARSRVLPMSALRARLTEPLRLLAAPRRDAAARHATLKATIDWSWELLDEQERRTFATCSVFAGGFGLEAAEAVLDVPWALDALQALVDHGLLKVEGRAGEPRFSWLRILHAYAADKLGGDERVRAEARHGAFFAALGTPGALRSLREHGGTELNRRLVHDLDNLLAAVARAVERRDAAVAVPCALAASEALFLVGPHATSLALIDGVLALPLAGQQRARLRIHRGLAAHMVHGNQAFLADIEKGLAGAAAGSVESAFLRGLEAQALAALGQVDEARTKAASSVAELERLGAGPEATRISTALVNLDLQLGRYAEARQGYEAVLCAAREIGDRRQEGLILGNMGVLEVRTGRFAAAAEVYRRALALHREVGNARLAAMALTNLASVELDLGLLDEAEQRHDEAIEACRQLGLGRTLAITIGNLGNVRLRRGRLRDAVACYEEAAALLREREEPHVESVYRGNIAHLRGVLEPRPVSEERFLERVSDFEEAMAVARRGGNRPQEGSVRLNLAEFCRRAGRLSEAIRYADEAIAVGEELDIARFTGAVYCIRGHARIPNDLAGARQDLERGLAVLTDERPAARAEALCRLARLQLAEGDVEGARETVCEVERYVERLGIRDGEVRWLLDELAPDLATPSVRATSLPDG